jgi:hypothetical protein
MNAMNVNRKSANSLHSVAPRVNNANNEEGWGGKERSRKTPRKTKKASRAPKSKKANFSTPYTRTYKSRSAARLNSLRPVVRVKKVKQGVKEYELVTVIAEDNAENNEKYAAEGFEKKAGMTRELRGGRKSMAVWSLLKPIVGKANMNELAAMFSGVGLGKPKSPSPVRVANVAMAVQEEIDEAMAELAGMFSSRARV